MKHTLLYDDAIKANRVGGFVKGGKQFDVIRPGYDIQGRRRSEWTQIVHDGVPVYTVKLLSPISDILKRFDALWAEWIGDDEALLEKVLTSNRHQHMTRFRDGITGETVAPTHTRDGSMQAKVEKPT